jgi:integrase
LSLARPKARRRQQHGNSGQSLYIVSQMLGHAQTSTTQRYAHLASETLLKAVNAAADNMGTDWNASSAA